MNGYEKIVNMIKNQNNPEINLFLVEMDSDTSCYINNLLLDSNDLYIVEHLKTGYVKKNTQSGSLENVEPLKKGDTVLIMKLNDTKYVILERVV